MDDAAKVGNKKVGVGFFVEEEAKVKVKVEVEVRGFYKPV